MDAQTHSPQVCIYIYAMKILLMLFFPADAPDPGNEGHVHVHKSVSLLQPDLPVLRPHTFSG